jgi:hypothetical protein
MPRLRRWGKSAKRKAGSAVHPGVTILLNLLLTASRNLVPAAKGDQRNPGLKAEDAMTRPILSLTIDDLSPFARRLHDDLTQSGKTPGHLALMNMLSRAAGYQNFQHLRAGALAAPFKPTSEPVDQARLTQGLRHFDAQGQFLRWPAKTNLQHLAVWGLWSHLPRGLAMSERQISDRLNTLHLFGDAAILRRTLVELQLVTRNEGGREYRRQERAPGPTERALIRHLHGIQ